MADLKINFAGIRSPNPFWLASAPPTDKAYNVIRAFKAGWGGVVWKTLGEEGPPVVNVNGPRYGAIWGADRRLLGLNNIELIGALRWNAHDRSHCAAKDGCGCARCGADAINAGRRSRRRLRYGV
jgi:dihydroorotate dehydrogenase